MTLAGTDDGERAAGEAVEWFVRMRGPDAPMLEAAFEAWLAGGEERHRAYQRVADTFTQSQILNASRMFAPPAPPSSGGGGRRIVLAWAASILAAACLTLVFALAARNFWLEPAMASGRELATAKGEIRTFALGDGSRVTLDTSSRVQVWPDKRAGHVHLIAGRVRVALGHGGRPYVIDAGAGRISTSAGTFDVALLGTRASVSVVRGQGEIGARAGPISLAFWKRPEALLAGRTFSYTARSFADAAFMSQRAETGRIAWPSGWAEYRATPLSALVQEANRYTARPIVLDTPGLARLEVTGRFRLTDAEGLARRLATLFDLDLVRTETALRLRAR